jgi:MFS family permease
VVLFNVSNSATLPLVGEILSKDNHGSSSAWQISAAVAVAEIVMVAVAAFAGKKADPWGRKPLFLTAFAFLAIRNGLSVSSHNPYYLISLQAFDGVAAAIYGVLLTLVTADLAKGTGRFNLLQGSIQSAMGLGGFLSNIVFGFIAKSMGFNASFIGLSAVAVVGGIFYQFMVPETRGDQPKEEEKKAA